MVYSQEDEIVEGHGGGMHEASLDETGLTVMKDKINADGISIGAFCSRA